ncbi:hypothetical protein HPQ64_02990 [Rhizobiales bacterium]|uniref:CDP-alcohol phosphatidyltransferase family protein n=1 Tax=Hongsoonwoonella zoysiae TaxID=2821844 RepID=UPI00155F9E58|nr:CDP-alcohol phosphatidyltransferase family protein [Hongsoonwoonella zoysiae]NRG16650.1 hypothetical protein [Hongsoonwoonella zoysiae]
MKTPGLGAFVGEYKANKLVEELKGNWANVIIHRAPAFLLAWLLARFGVSPLAATLLSLPVALALPILALALPLKAAVFWVFVAGYLFQVLDCADGSLARVTGRVTYLGGRIDFLIDMAQWGLLYVGIGILADRTLGGEGFWTALAAVAAWLRLYGRTVRDAFADRADADAEKPATLSLSPSALAIAFISGLSGLVPFLAFVAAVPSLASYAVWFLIVYSVLDVGDSLAQELVRAINGGPRPQ